MGNMYNHNQGVEPRTNNYYCLPTSNTASVQNNLSGALTSLQPEYNLT